MLLRVMLSRRSNGIKGIVNSPAGLTTSVGILKIKYFQWYVRFHILLLNITDHKKIYSDLLRVIGKLNITKRK